MRTSAAHERGGRDRRHGRGGKLSLARRDGRRPFDRDWFAGRYWARTGAATLAEAFIALLPEEAQRPQGDRHSTAQREEGPPAIEANGLTKRFGDFVAVDNVSFRIGKGEIFGFLGSNGCGKSTTMKMLTGLLPPTDGKATLFGRPVIGDDMETRRQVGYMSQAFSLYGELSVRRNLELHARLFDLAVAERGKRVEEMPIVSACVRSPTPTRKPAARHPPASAIGGRDPAPA